MNDQNLQVIKPDEVNVPARQSSMSAMQILQTAIEHGISKENIEAVKELRQMVKEERDDQAKIAFNRAFFQLRKEMPVLYADREVKTKSGAVAFQYVSPDEIKNMLEPLMSKYGFCTLAGQTMTNGEVTVTVTLIHEAGHSEPRSFTVRVSPGNQLMSPTQCDASASSSAERHCLIKMFGLRTRIKSDSDPRNVGEIISPDLADELERRVHETNSNVEAFLKFGGSRTGKFSDIPAARYSACDAMLRRKESEGK
jgi:hypothetical protein